MTNIKKAIQQMAGKDLMQTYLCKVVSVDNHTCDCEPVSGGANFLDVRLRSILDNGTGGIILKPKVDSIVIIGLLENNEATAFVIAYSDIDELYFKSDGGMTFEVKKDVVKINGDQQGNILIESKLKSELDKVNQILNALKQVCSVPINEPGNGSPSAFQAGLNTALSSLQIPSYQNISNTKVKHG